MSGKSRKILKRSILGLLAATGLLLVLTACLLLFPPLETVKNRSLPLLRQKTGLDIGIGRIDYSLFSGIELHDVIVRPPAGYETPLFKARRVALHYDLGGILAKNLKITELAIDDPQLAVETRNGKSSLDALLEGMPKGEKAAGEPVKPSGSGNPPGWKVVLERLAVSGLAAKADMGERRIELERLDLAASGFLSGTGSHLDLTLSIAGADPQKPNVLLDFKTPADISAALSLSLTVRLSADNLYDFSAPTFMEAFKPRAVVKAELGVATRGLKAPEELSPFELKADLAARADLASDEAVIERFGLEVDGAPWLSMRARLAGLFSSRDLLVELDRLQVPLARIAPYVKAFVKDVDFGGSASVEDLKATLGIPSPFKPVVPVLQGRVRLEDVWADARPLGFSLKGLNLDMTLTAAPETGTPVLDRPAVMALGELRLEKAWMPFLSAAGVSLSMEARAADMDAASQTAGLASLTAGLTAKTAVYHDKSLGDMPFSLRTSLDLAGRPRTGEWTVESLELELSRLIRLKLGADARIDPEMKSLPEFKARAELAPVDLRQLLAVLPKGVSALLPRMQLDGSLRLSLDLHGRLPDFSFRDPLGLPVLFDLSASVEKLAGAIPAYGIGYTGGSITLNVRGKPSKADMKGEAAFSRAEYRNLKVSLEGIRLPIEGSFEPLEARAKIGLAMSRAVKSDTGAVLAGVNMDADVKAAGRLYEMDLRSAEAHIGLKIDSALSARSPELNLKGTSLSLDAVHSFAGGRTGLKAGLAVRSLEMPAARLSAQGTEIAASATAEGLDPLKGIMPHGPVVLSLEGKAKRLEYPGALDAPLENTGFSLALALERLRDLSIDRLEFSVPSLGLKAGIKGKVSNLADDREGAVDFKGRWPEFDLTAGISVSLDGPRRLSGGVEAMGKAGLTARLRSIAGRRFQVDGNLSARHFDLTSRKTGVETREDGSAEDTLRAVSIRDFNADVPVSMKVSLDTFRPEPGVGSVLEGRTRGVLYEAMRPYLREQSNFRMKRLNYHAENGGTSRDITLDDLSLDMLVKDDVFAIDRMYVALLGGGVSGRLQVQFISTPQAPLDLRIHFENQITGIDPAVLMAGRRGGTSGPSEISTLVDLDFSLREMLVQGHIDFTRLSLSQLDDILHFLDPQDRDPSIRSNRRLLNAWYVKGVRPRIKLVSMRLQYSNLNMDIGMDAFVVGPLLQNILDGMKIRRFNIKPTLGRLLGGQARQDGAASAAAE